MKRSELKQIISEVIEEGTSKKKKTDYSKVVTELKKLESNDVVLASISEDDEFIVYKYDLMVPINWYKYVKKSNNRLDSEGGSDDPAEEYVTNAQKSIIDTISKKGNSLIKNIND